MFVQIGSVRSFSTFVPVLRCSRTNDLFLTHLFLDTFYLFTTWSAVRVFKWHAEPAWTKPIETCKMYLQLTSSSHRALPFRKLYKMENCLSDFVVSLTYHCKYVYRWKVRIHHGTCTHSSPVNFHKSGRSCRYWYCTHSRL